MTAPGYVDVQPAPDAPLHASTGPVVPEEELVEAAVADPDATEDFAEEFLENDGDDSDESEDSEDESGDNEDEDSDWSEDGDSTTVAGS